MSTSAREPRRSPWSRTTSTPMPPHRSTKPFPPPRPGAWPNASNGLTRPNTAPGSTWPNPNSVSPPRNVSTGVSPINRQSSTRSPPGSANETKITPAPVALHNQRRPHQTEELVPFTMIRSRHWEDLMQCLRRSASRPDPRKRDRGLRRPRARLQSSRRKGTGRKRTTFEMSVPGRARAAFERQK